MKKLQFPDGFLWGTSTAAYQVEGGIENNWSRWEPTVAQQLAESAQDRLEQVVPRWQLIAPDATSANNYISGDAAGHSVHYQQDILHMQELGFSAYRFSIEWARVEPQPGEFDDEALDYYRSFTQALREAGIEPIICLHHFTSPAWVEDSGGWHNPTVVEHFVEYANKVITHLADDCSKWLTFNEANALLLSKYLGGGIWPDWPKSEISPLHLLQALRNMVQAHKQVYKQAKQLDDSLEVGQDHGVVLFRPARRDPLTLLVTGLTRYLATLFPRRIDGYEDFLGIHYYLKVDMKFRLSSPQQWATHSTDTKTDFGWGIYPQGIYEITQQLKRKGLPIYITENGLADARDALRAEFIRDHLMWLHASIEDGADVRGYLHWSLFDNFEWSEGYWPKFGLIAVDRDTQARVIKPSAREYAQIIAQNGLRVESVPVQD